MCIIASNSEIAVTATFRISDRKGLRAKIIIQNFLTQRYNYCVKSCLLHRFLGT